MIDDDIVFCLIQTVNVARLHSETDCWAKHVVEEAIGPEIYGGSLLNHIDGLRTDMESMSIGSDLCVLGSSAPSPQH
jgi:hypothetical protein